MQTDSITATLLSDTAGCYRETAPIAALGAHIRCVWTNRMALDHRGPITVLPDGCVDLIWSEHGLRVAGPDVAPAYPTLAPGATIIGARFAAGAAARWLGADMSDIVGRQIDLREFWGERAREMAARISEETSTPRRLARFQALLAARGASIEAPASDMQAVFALLKAGQESRPHRALDMSERTLRRRCLTHFGYGAKTLARILRFQNFLARARHAPRASLATLALDSGYADQAHLTREVGALADQTPAALLRDRAS